AAIGAGDDEAAVMEFDVERRGLEQVPGDGLALLDDLLRRGEEGGTADAGRARAEGAAAVEDEVGVAVDQPHMVRGQSQEMPGELPIHGLVTLAVRMRPRQHRGMASRVEADLDRFFQGEL